MFVFAIAIVFVIASDIVYAANEGHNVVTFFCNLNQISFVALSVISFWNEIFWNVYFQVLYFLLREKHKSYSLLEDRRVRNYELYLSK